MVLCNLKSKLNVLLGARGILVYSVPVKQVGSVAVNESAAVEAMGISQIRSQQVDPNSQSQSILERTCKVLDLDLRIWLSLALAPK